MSTGDYGVIDVEELEARFDPDEAASYAVLSKHTLELLQAAFLELRALRLAVDRTRREGEG